MTKKHFNKIAALIKQRMGEPPYSHQEYANGRRDALRELTIDLTQSFEEFNPNFDKERFFHACGLWEDGTFKS